MHNQMQSRSNNKHCKGGPNKYKSRGIRQIEMHNLSSFCSNIDYNFVLNLDSCSSYQKPSTKLGVHGSSSTTLQIASN